MKTVSFVKRKFNQMLAVGTMTMAVNYVVMLSGSVIAGNLIGADGLSALNVCTPAFGVASFLASLLSVGTALVFSRAMGAFDERRAARVFSQSLALSVVMGAVIFAAMRFGGDAFLDLTGVTGAVRTQAEGYWRMQSVAMALLPLVLLLESLVYADGDAVVAALAGLVHVAGAIGLSVWYVRLSGAAYGVAGGMVFTMLFVLCVCGLHAFRRNNHLKFGLGFSAADLRETLAASLADSTIYLCWGALVFIVNRFAVAAHGQDLLPVVALAASIVEFSIVFDGVGEALIPVGGMYAGEGNRPALRELANHSALMATLEGIVCGAALYWLAPQVAGLYGLRGESAALLPEAVGMARALAFAMPFMGLLMMMNTHYLVVRHIPFAVSVTVMKDFACPCLGVLALGAAFGTKGMWLGFAVGYAAAAAYPFLFVLARHGRDRFPWLIERDDGRSDNFAIMLTEAALGDAKARVATFLNDHELFETGPLLEVIERSGRATILGNRRQVCCEYFVSVEDRDAVRLIVRDSGRPADVSRNLGAPAERKYLNTLGCNRTEWRFSPALAPFERRSPSGGVERGGEIGAGREAGA